MRLRHLRVPIPRLSAATMQELVEITAQTELTGAPRDDSQDQPGTGHIVVPRAPLAVFDAAGGSPIARIRPVWAGTEAWLPVIDWQPGWVRVLLPTRPNGATGWLDASRVTTARTRYRIQLSLSGGTLSLLRGEQRVGAWPANQHAKHDTVAAGRTFVLASVRRGPATPPMLLRLAVHLHDRDAGLLTIHPRSSPAGAAAASGGIGVPDEAMAALHVVPPGCLVHLEAR
ncbi:hypothetical protein [Nucisporomicrobium flavum]|uniref:hypothetical protein n=1 Tax=Nucisporomicrobium flavum TaxID=2785915 RepID=UPI0018F51245|nr:hypothetical protein [Nucisporomicrobium flavum]